MQAENSAVAKYLAEQYCATHSVSKPIEVISSLVLRKRGRDGSVLALYNVEEVISSSFKKWTTNSGVCLDWNDDLFGFSKWAHEMSSGYLFGV